jgi:magnesium chelatase family protein
MLAKVWSGTTIGLDGQVVAVEVDVTNRGFPVFTIVGLPGKEISESRDRIRSALQNSNFSMPDSRLTVNLAPADIPKSGSKFDLPIAIGILVGCGVVERHSVRDAFFVGELSLEGDVRPVAGVIPLAVAAKDHGFQTLFVPRENANECAIVDDINIIPLDHLRDVVNHLRGEITLKPHKRSSVTEEQFPSTEFDFADVQGQDFVKRALEIAAAGFHNIHLKGVPGVGKTMLARAFPSILPPLERHEILEVSKIYSVVGLLGREGRIMQRPFRSPHHTVSKIGLIGGGTQITPGEISLAHRGVLFLDEFPEFDRSSLEALRQPLEDGVVTISRAAGTLTFPARFLLLAASNPCPCGYLGHPKKPCTCLAGAIAKYQKKISGPLLDRIDLHVDVMPVEPDTLTQVTRSENSESVRKRVISARAIQRARLRVVGKITNGEMSSTDVKKLCQVEDDAKRLLQQAVAKLSLSARSYFKIVKVAQTIADLDRSDTISPQHVAQALQFRVKGE